MRMSFWRTHRASGHVTTSLVADSVLQDVYDRFRASGEWPPVRQLQRDYLELGDFRTIAARIGRGHLVCEEGPSGRCILTLDSIAARPSAKDDLAIFCAAIRFTARHFAAHGTKPISASEFRTELTLDDAGTRRLGALLRLEALIWLHATYTPAGNFSFGPGERAIFFEHVTSYSEYVDAATRVRKEDEERGMLMAAEYRRSIPPRLGATTVGDAEGASTAVVTSDAALAATPGGWLERLNAAFAKEAERRGYFWLVVASILSLATAALAVF